MQCGQHNKIVFLVSRHNAKKIIMHFWPQKGSFWSIRAIFWAKTGPLYPPRSLPCNMINTKMLSFWCPVMMVPKKNERCPQKLISGQKTSFFDPKRAILGNWGQKMARRATKRPHTRIPKVSRVTSGYGGLMIPLIRIHLTPKNGGYMGVA